jgi:hypothetical protein
MKNGILAPFAIILLGMVNGVLAHPGSGVWKVECNGGLTRLSGLAQSRVNEYPHPGGNWI